MLRFYSNQVTNLPRIIGKYESGIREIALISFGVLSSIRGIPSSPTQKRDATNSLKYVI